VKIHKMKEVELRQSLRRLFFWDGIFAAKAQSKAVQVVIDTLLNGSQGE
jgi:hypothetical protein